MVLSAVVQGRDDQPRTPFTPPLVVSCMVVGARRGAFGDDLSVICVLGEPSFLSLEWVPLAVRRAAAGVLYHVGADVPKAAHAAVEALMHSRVCQRDSGGVDLSMIGAVAHHLASGATEQIFKWLGEEAILSALVEEPVYSAPFLGVLDDSHLAWA